MVIDHTLIELSYAGDTLTLFVQLNPRERQAVNFTPEAFDRWIAELTRIAMAWRRERSRVAPDHYQVLGVSRDATADEIQSAYRLLAKKYHPDVAGDTAAMQQLNEAYAVVGDPQQRQQYDHTVNSP